VKKTIFKFTGFWYNIISLFVLVFSIKSYGDTKKESLRYLQSKKDIVVFIIIALSIEKKGFRMVLGNLKNMIPLVNMQLMMK
jgi:hypothetical protein